MWYKTLERVIARPSSYINGFDQGSYQQNQQPNQCKFHLVRRAKILFTLLSCESTSADCFAFKQMCMSAAVSEWASLQKCIQMCINDMDCNGKTGPEFCYGIFSIATKSLFEEQKYRFGKNRIFVAFSHCRTWKHYSWGLCCHLQE